MTSPGESYPGGQGTGRKGAREGRAPGPQLPGLHRPLCPSCWAGWALSPRAPLTLAGPRSHRLPEKTRRAALASLGVSSCSGRPHRGDCCTMPGNQASAAGGSSSEDRLEGLPSRVGRGAGLCGPGAPAIVGQNGTRAWRGAVLAARALMTPGREPPCDRPAPPEPSYWGAASPSPGPTGVSSSCPSPRPPHLPCEMF